MIKNKDELSTIFGMSDQPSSASSADVRSIVLIGENSDVDTATVPETLFHVGGQVDFPTTATVATIVSTSTDDALGGTGAQIVLVEGLDANYREQWEVVNLNGTNSVTTTNSYLRVNFFRVVYSGSGKGNAGSITCVVNAKTLHTIDVGEAIAHSLVYTVPEKHTFFLNSQGFGIVRSATDIRAEVQIKVYVPSTATNIASSAILVTSAAQYSQRNAITSMPRIPEKSDIWWDCIYCSANNARIFGTVRGQLVHESWIEDFAK